MSVFLFILFKDSFPFLIDNHFSFNWYISTCTGHTIILKQTLKVFLKNVYLYKLSITFLFYDKGMILNIGSKEISNKYLPLL